MADSHKEALRVGFDGSLKLESHGAKVTSDAGLLVYRELDEAFRLTAAAAAVFAEWRTGSHARHVVFQMAEVAVPEKLLEAILRRIRARSSGGQMGDCGLSNGSREQV